MIFNVIVQLCFNERSNVFQCIIRVNLMPGTNLELLEIMFRTAHEKDLEKTTGI